MSKEFKGKTLRNPSGKAGEYSYWACDFFRGCSVGCTYCFNKKGRSVKILGGDTPILKSGFKNKEHALSIFQKEVLRNVESLRECGLFFSFNTDVMLPEVKNLSFTAISFALDRGIPIKILSKIANFNIQELGLMCHYKRKMIAVGFTLTGHDELEPFASPNIERIKTMQKLHDVGFKTFASVEPIIDLKSSRNMIEQSKDCCDLFKIGLESGKKYDRLELRHFIVMISNFTSSKIYFKDSLLKAAGIDRKDLPANCVGRDFNIFKS